VSSHVTRRADKLILHSFIDIRLVDLLNGWPHEMPSQKIITVGLCHSYYPRVVNSQISGSRIALIIEAVNPTPSDLRRELIVWDWKTWGVVSDFLPWEIDFDQISTQVLRYTSDDAGIGNVMLSITAVYFLEGPWLLALCHRSSTPQLLVLNMLLPQQDRRSWRILDLPQLSNSYRRYSVISRYEKPPTELPEFLVDPAQRILVLTSQGNMALVTPVELLIQRIRSAGPNPCIPWEEWAEDTITVPLHPDTHSLQLFDTKLLALCCSLSQPVGWGVRMYDLSKSGRRDIQVQQVDDGAGGGYRRVLSSPKWFARCQRHGHGVPHEVKLVGNKVVCLYVSPLCAQKCSCHIQRFTVQVRSSPTGRVSSLNVWELG